MKMPRASLLDAQPPEGGEGPELPLESLTEGFQVSLTEDGVLWALMRVGQCHEDNPSLEGSERTSIDARQTPQEVPAACPGEAAHLLSDTTTATPMRTEPDLGSGVLK